MTQYGVCLVLHGEAAVPLGLCWSRKGMCPPRSWEPPNSTLWTKLGLCCGWPGPRVRAPKRLRLSGYRRGAGFQRLPRGYFGLAGTSATRSRARRVPPARRNPPPAAPPAAQPLTCHRRWLAQHQPPTLPLRRQDSVRGRPRAPVPRPRPHPRPPPPCAPAAPQPSCRPAA